MKILSVNQPYAALLVSGKKLTENRTWPAAYRGQLLIHASKSKRLWIPSDAQDFPDAQFGGIVGIVDLIDCCPIDDLAARHPHLADHEHAEGPWCWVCRNARPLEFIPLTGRLGLWNAPAEIVEAVNLQLSGAVA